MQGPYDNQGIVCPWFFVLGVWEENLGFQWCDCPFEIFLRQPFEREKWHVKPHTHATLTSMEKKDPHKAHFVKLIVFLCLLMVPNMEIVCVKLVYQ